MKAIAGTDAIPDYGLTLIEGGAAEGVETGAGAPAGRGRGRKAAPATMVITPRPASEDEAPDAANIPDEADAPAA